MYMLGMIFLSVSVMSMLIFACVDDVSGEPCAGHSSGRARKRWGSGGGGVGGGGCGGGGGGCGVGWGWWGMLKGVYV
ncbi:hypothetical protein PHJA_000017400 [Phtheirospermum japonicum]|uniref:Glycine-rich protein n=1 Tax=Phtheirospermum japonicum TaxID=374723 RepID=A0A830B0K6_9LAMI|nr:hypothetical protein PHJA_000017400 [Phtheirospermum japonicum]